MNAFKALALGTVAGFVFAFAASCSSTPKCSPANCTGCCDTTKNTCLATASETSSKCGASGNACVACTGSQTCVAGACTGGCTGSNCNDGGSCGPANCPNGCCTGNNCINGSGLVNAFCGSGGNACTACTTGTQTCNVTTSGGTCVAVGPDGGPSGGIGTACAVDSDCHTFLGDAGVCLLTTADAGAQYPGGYCTILKCGAGNGGQGSCPGKSTCWNMGGLALASGQPAFDFYGETRTMCLGACGSDFDCVRPSDTVPNYACFAGDQTDNNNNYVTSNFGCFLNLPAKSGETGVACDPTDTSTPGFEKCALPPTNGGCFSFGLNDGGHTPGVCGSFCIGALLDNTHGADYWCGDGGFCFWPGNTTPGGDPFNAICTQKCSTPMDGGGECTQGNLCWSLTQTDGGQLPFGFCQPSCKVLGGCNTGFTCNDAGYCQ